MAEVGFGGGQRRASATSGYRMSVLEKLMELPWSLIFLIVAVAITGTGMLYSAVHGSEANAGLPWAHLLRFAIAFVVMIVLAVVPLSIWARLALPAYVATVALLIAVELFGSVRGGAQRWLDIGPIAVQPSEFMKLALTLMLARYYHSAFASDNANSGPLVHIPAMALMAIPAALIFMQPDFGTMLALLAAGGVIVFLAGLDGRVIAGAIVAGVCSVPLVYSFVLEDYQRERVDTFVEQLQGEGDDALGDSYQIEQAKIAIGSGGLTGKGFLNGTQSQLDYIPEQHTDFILTVIAEELGFLGVVALMTAWAVILTWGMLIAKASASPFGKYAAAGAMGMVAFYIVFNVGMVAGLLPVVGVPMPLVSYGGTAMITVMAAFGLLLSVHVHRNESISRGGFI